MTPIELQQPDAPALATRELSLGGVIETWPQGPQECSGLHPLPCDARSCSAAAWLIHDDGIRNLALLEAVPVSVTAELGSVSMPVADILSLRLGFIIGLDKLAQEPVNLKVNGRLFARGEVVVVDEHFAVRLTEIAAAAGTGDQ